jgi:hypothetical protein
MRLGRWTNYRAFLDSRRLLTTRRGLALGIWTFAKNYVNTPKDMAETGTH